MKQNPAKCCLYSLQLYYTYNILREISNNTEFFSNYFDELFFFSARKIQFRHVDSRTGSAAGCDN